jgi:hypothetical protein
MSIYKIKIKIKLSERRIELIRLFYLTYQIQSVFIHQDYTFSPASFLSSYDLSNNFWKIEEYHREELKHYMLWQNLRYEKKIAEHM